MRTRREEQNIKEELRFLVNFLEKSAKEQKETAVQEECDYLKGRADGSKLTYELCAKWIKEIIEKGEASQ